MVIAGVSVHVGWGIDAERETQTVRPSNKSGSGNQVNVSRASHAEMVLSSLYFSVLYSDLVLNVSGAIGM